MEAKFTKGPWVKAETQGDNLRTPKIRLIRPQDGSVGAICYVYGDESVECKSNQNLIAAAPDLYNALEVLAAYCEFRGIPTDAAYAALAKARGEQP